MRIKMLFLSFLSACLLLASGVSASNHPLPIPVSHVQGVYTYVITPIGTGVVLTAIAGHHATQTAIAQQSPTPTP